MDSNEVESTMLFKQATGNLLSVRNLEGCLNVFGFSPDDRIERRELVLMYRAVEKEMEIEISRLALSGQYDKAKEMRARLTDIRREFDELQCNGARVIRRDQQTLFEKASATFFDGLGKSNKVSTQLVHDECDRILADQKLTHEIQWENLEKQLARIPMPRMKYSKRAIELFKAESELIKLCQYDDARKVRRMLDRLVPVEEKKFSRQFEEKIELRRVQLLEEQAQDIIRLEEKLKKMKWDEARRCDRESNIGKQRIKNHIEDMLHTHTLEDKLRPEMSVKPSALWQKRYGYDGNSAALRGQQLFDLVKGKQKGHQVFAESLVERHDFDTELKDTWTLNTRSLRSSR